MQSWNQQGSMTPRKKLEKLSGGSLLMQKCGLDIATGELPRSEEVIWVIKSQISIKEKSIREMFEAAGVEYLQSAHSASFSRVWKLLGEKENLIKRRKVHRRRFMYSKVGKKIDGLSFGELTALYKSINRIVGKQSAECEQETSEAPDVRNGINLKVHFNITFIF